MRTRAICLVLSHIIEVLNASFVHVKQGWLIHFSFKYFCKTSRETRMWKHLTLNWKKEAEDWE